MKTKTLENATILIDEQDDIKGFAGYLARTFNKFKDHNIILDLAKYDKAQLDDLLAFLILSNEHKMGKKSFVIINDALPVEEIPAELIVVPTQQEALDVIQMEDIERDLGF